MHMSLLELPAQTIEMHRLHSGGWKSAQGVGRVDSFCRLCGRLPASVTDGRTEVTSPPTRCTCKLLISGLSASVLFSFDFSVLLLRQQMSSLRKKKI